MPCERINQCHAQRRFLKHRPETMFALFQPRYRLLAFRDISNRHGKLVVTNIERHNLKVLVERLNETFKIPRLSR